MASIMATFSAAIQSVGTTATMASVGFYMHRRGHVTTGGTKTLALLSQQVTIPALLFTGIVRCPESVDGSCRSVTDNLGDISMLIWWPFFVVGCGLFVGYLASWISGTPASQRRSVLATCGFANSTGLPITLLTVIYRTSPKNSDLGMVDPMPFLSVYLLLYPVLQWGIGGWLLASKDEEEHIEGGNRKAEKKDEPYYIRHILNIDMPKGMKRSNSSKTEMLLRELSFNSLPFSELSSNIRRNASGLAFVDPECPYDPPAISFSHSTKNDKEKGVCNDQTYLLEPIHSTPSGEPSGDSCAQKNVFNSKPVDDIIPLTETISRVAKQSIQPPVLGALLGMLIASNPIFRSIFVNVYNTDSGAPLDFFFDGLSSVGQAAVPVNMCILGINLSMVMQTKQEVGVDALSRCTMLAVVVSKMVVMPFIGVLCAFVLRNYLWHIPHDIEASFYLVLMVVFITPTANNVMVMVELSGSNLKEEVARLIGWQYAVAPVMLTLSVTIVVFVASHW